MTDIPFDFVLDYLPTNITLKKMFGMHYIYMGKRILLILRKRNNEPQFNGVWVATTRSHHESLKNEIPELVSTSIVGDEQPGNWLLIHESAEDLEGASIKVCDLISRGDGRIGRVTKKSPVG
jgi:hypothetical protein